MVLWFQMQFQGQRKCFSIVKKIVSKQGEVFQLATFKENILSDALIALEKLEMPHLATVACNLHLTSNLISTD